MRKYGITTVLIWLLLLGASMAVWGYARNDPFALLLTVLRVLVMVPVLGLLGWAIVRLVSGPATPGPDFFEVLTDNQNAYSIGTKIAVGMVISTILFCVFWAGIQV